MFPLFPFVVGVLTGAVALRLVKTDKTRAGLEKAQGSLRNATVSGLEIIEQASARARKRLAAGEAEEVFEAEAPPEAEIASTPKATPSTAPDADDDEAGS